MMTKDVKDTRRLLNKVTDNTPLATFQDRRHHFNAAQLVRKRTVEFQHHVFAVCHTGKTGRILHSLNLAAALAHACEVSCVLNKVPARFHEVTYSPASI
jgi:hypothetical protein